jgi:hypothetical protein
MTKRFCERCQSMVPEKGLHFCVKAEAAPSPHKPEPSSNAPTHNPTHGITHAPTHAKPAKSELRKAQTYRWRERYPDRWKQYHAEYMRNWRANRNSAAAGGCAKSQA